MILKPVGMVLNLKGLGIYGTQEVKSVRVRHGSVTRCHDRDVYSLRTGLDRKMDPPSRIDHSRTCALFKRELSQDS